MSSPRLRTTTDKGSFYRWHNDPFPFASVTTIIGGGVPKKAIPYWAARRVAEVAFDMPDEWTGMARADAVRWLKGAPWRERDAAAVKGGDIHDWCERYVLGHPVTVDDAPEEQRPYLAGFLSFIADWEPTWEMAEASVFNRQYRWAGTLDAIMTIEHQNLGRLLVDYKTNATGVFPETSLQLAAYRHAEFVAMPDGSEVPMPEVDRCAVLHLTPNGYHFVPVKAGYEEYRYFLYAAQVRDFIETDGPTCIGNEYRLPQPAAR